jgi:outer membrane protein OmpA-like peptidoglycan-associated protein
MMVRKITVAVDPHGLTRRLLLLATGGAMLSSWPARAVDFGSRTPDVAELQDALAPPRRTRGVGAVSGLSAAGKGRVSMQIGFDFGSSRVLERDLDKVERLAQALNAEGLREVPYEVVGHTDATGSMAFNIKLSQQRAQSVLDQLVERGVQRARLSSVGKGPVELLNKEDPAAAENRRVEIRVLR